MYKYLKLAGAVLLLVSLALPVSQCAHHEDAEGRPILVREGETPPEGAVKVVQYSYVLSSFDPANSSDWGILAAYTWPVVVFGILVWKRRGIVSVGVRILEPLFLCWSLYVVDFISSFLTGGKAIGAYLSFVALAVYAIGALLADFTLFRQWRAGSSESGTSG
jgi:hypothetical protein